MKRIGGLLVAAMLLCALCAGQFALADTQITDGYPSAALQNAASTASSKAASLRLNAQNLVIGPGRTFQFKNLTTGKAATGYSWSIQYITPAKIGSKPSMMDEANGVFIAGSSVGEMLSIRCVAPNGKRATVRVQIKEVPVSIVKFKKALVTVGVNNTVDVSKYLTVSPATADDLSVTWSSNKESVATVDQAGTVNVVGEGKAVITATSVLNPAKSGSIAVVGKAVRVKTLSLPSLKGFADPAETIALLPSISPKSASFQEVTYSVDNEAVATIEQDGTLTAVAPGKAIVTLSTDKGKKKLSYTLRVRGGNMRTVKISAMGDVVIGGDKKFVARSDGLLPDKKTSFKRFEELYLANGAGYFFGGVKSVLENDDVSVINYEGVMSSNGGLQGDTYNFQAPKEYGEILKAGSIEAACLANNHAPTDLGGTGYKNTRNNLDSWGIKNFGGGLFTNTKVAIVTAQNGVKIGFVGYVMPLYYAGFDRQIRHLRKQCDIVVASFHWTKTKEWSYKIEAMEKSAAHHAISYGADLVLGHHKHALSGLEQYKGRTIAYDLGNFVAMIRNQLVKNGPYTDKDTMIFQQKFNVFEDGTVEYVNPNIVPCMNSDTQDTMTGNPHILQGEEAERVLTKVRNRSLASGAPLVAYDPNY